MSLSTPIPMVRVVRATALVLVTAWAAFWTWFCAGVAISEGGQSYLYGGGIIAIAWGVTALAWWRPVWGGLMLMATGVVAAWVFQGASAWMLMAAPPEVAGMMLLASQRCGGPRLTPA
jgi:hypothetical protein